MDKIHILCVLLVTLSWTFLGTDANMSTTHASNMTTPHASNMTTPHASNMTTAHASNMTTPHASNMTTMGGNGVTNSANVSTTNASNRTTPHASNMTTPHASNMTTPHASNMTTTHASNMTTTHASNMTTIGGNGVTNSANMSTTHSSNMTTTAASNLTTTHISNMTTPHASNMTTPHASNMTTTHANNMTTMGGNVGATNSANTTAAASTVSPNNTVVPLEKNISNTECGSQQLCVAEPSKCNPAKTESCFFLAAKQQSGRNFLFELAGESDGYIAATLTGGNAAGNPTYICAKSKGAVKFFSALLQDDKLTISELAVNSVKGKSKGRRIECSFLATVPEPRRAKRAVGTTMSVSTGEFNETDNTLGAPSPVIRATVDDLGNPNTTVTNEISSNTTTNATTAGPANNATTAGPANNATTAGPANNATTAGPPNNATIAGAANNATTAGPPNNATTAGPANNATTAGAANNATTAASSGTVIPALQASISRDECGSTKLCAAEPSACNPALADSCYFLSAQQQRGQTYDFELSGQSDGYIAAGLSTSTLQSGRHDAYICANKNGSVIFFTGTLNNFVLNLTELDSSNQRGNVSNGKIQCRFTAVLPDTSTRAASYALSVSTGSYDPNSGQLGRANFRILTNLANLSDPTANLTNLLNNGTTSASSSLVTPTHSFLPVLLVTVCMLAFTAM